MVLPNFVKRALEGETDHGSRRRHQTRSFTWVGDVVSAMLKLVQRAESAVGEVFNIGNGAEISIRELAEKVKAMTGSTSPVEFVPYTAVFDDSFEDMPRRVPDIGKIRQMVGYAPSVHLDEIIANVIAYWQVQRSIDRIHHMTPAAAAQRSATVAAGARLM